MHWRIVECCIIVHAIKMIRYLAYSELVGVAAVQEEAAAAAARARDTGVTDYSCTYCKAMVVAVVAI